MVNSVKNKYGQRIKDQFSSVITTTKRKPKKTESDQGKKFYNNVFHTFLKFCKIHHYSRYSDKRPSIAEKIKNLFVIYVKNQFSENEILRG